MRNSLLNFLVAYSFLTVVLGREIGLLPYDMFIIITIALLWIVTIVTSPSEYWQDMNTDVSYLMLFWFMVSVLELMNPGANIVGALAELKTVALYPVLLVPISFVIVRTNRHLDIFLIIIITISTLGAINGIKQLYIGPSRGEQMFLNAGGASTHVLWGKLRVFSFYSEAGQFGASQAAIGITTLILAIMGPFKKWKRILMLVCSLLMLYGMLISGTRGALFALLVGAFVAIVLSKNIKVLIMGGVILAVFICFLKFTHIADSNYQIYRLRSAFNPKDASLNVRILTQHNLKIYMSSRPFGGGLGVLGFNSRYNEGTYLATVQPDSYFVKIWAMYGVVGLTIWISIMLYILGKCCGISWRMKEPLLRAKVVALTAGFAGTLFCSYGNEVINNIPSSFVVYLSWVFISISPKLENAEKSNLLD